MHVESSEMDVLALVPDKGGPKLQPSKEGSVSALKNGQSGQMIFSRTSVVTLVNTLANLLQTPVVDGTNITGFFDFTLDPARFVVPQSPSPALSTGADSFSRRTQPVVDAVQEQLGLKLQRQKAQLDITVVDHAQKPDAN